MDSRKQASLLQQLTLGVLMTGALAPSHAMDPLTAINRANPSTMEWRIIGSCGFNLRVQHWIPLAWIETSPSGNSSLIDGVAARDGKSSVIRSSGLESSTAARVLNFSTPLWRTSRLALTHAEQVCTVEDAQAPGGGMEAFSSIGCDGQNFVQSALSQFDRALESSMTGLLMTQAYDSTLDSGWLSGCRDKARVDEAVAANLRCTSDMLDPNLITGGTSNTLLAGRNCLGKWGSLYPRQARDIGPTGPISSAKTAYRALSTARDHLGRIPYPVDVLGKLQQSYPSVSSSFWPGEKPLPANASLNADRKYGWIYWRKVQCCVGF